VQQKGGSRTQGDGFAAANIPVPGDGSIRVGDTFSASVCGCGVDVNKGTDSPIENLEVRFWRFHVFTFSRFLSDLVHLSRRPSAGVCHMQPLLIGGERGGDVRRSNAPTWLARIEWLARSG
jgi:hypothetical protein